MKRCLLDRRRWRIAAVAAVAAASLLATQGRLPAAITYSGGTYTQNFDSLTTTTHSSASTTFDPWTNDSTLPGWSLFHDNPITPITTYKGGTGGVNTGFFYSFGADGVAERSLGAIGSGSAYFGTPASSAVGGWIAVAITNNAATITSFSIEYDGEQWRDGGFSQSGSIPQTMVLEYGFGATFAGVSNWIAPGGTFDFTSPTFGSTSGVALDGNLGANRTAGLGGTISSLSWNPGETLWIRWIELNDLGNDHALAIDNFEFQATIVPEPSTFAMCCAGLLGLAVAWRRRRQ